MGDSGTYAIALLIGIYLIKFNFLNDIISPYYVAVMLWYPAFENLFSLLRRIIGKKNISKADNFHLHQLTYLFLKSKKFFQKILNSISAIIILAFNLPSMIIANFYASKSLNLIFLILANISLYIFFYYFFSQNLVKKKIV